MRTPKGFSVDILHSGNSHINNCMGVLDEGLANDTQDKSSVR